MINKKITGVNVAEGFGIGIRYNLKIQTQEHLYSYITFDHLMKLDMITESSQTKIEFRKIFTNFGKNVHDFEKNQNVTASLQNVLSLKKACNFEKKSQTKKHEFKT